MQSLFRFAVPEFRTLSLPLRHGGLRSGCGRRLTLSQSGEVHESYDAQAGEDDRLHDVNPEPRIRALSPNQFSVAVLRPHETEEDQ